MARAEQTSTTFRQSCSVTCRIAAPPERVWALLTNADDFARWNRTVTRLVGRIAPGERLAIEVAAAPGRTFRPRVTRFEPNATMEWSDGFAPMFKGVRTFSVTSNTDGTTEFRMEEVFRGLMLPMIRGSLPDFGPVFEAYANDLKNEAERTA